MINERDEWGRDPSVLRMRQVFSYMEAAQIELLKQLRISQLDSRLGRAREIAKGFFERAWALSVSRGMDIGEEEAAVLYIHCLAESLRKCGVEVSAEVLPDDERLSALADEVLQ